MTTIMWQGDNNGCTGRCDATCHNATESKCVCMCGGRYHGCGLKAGGPPTNMIDAELQAMGADPAVVSQEVKIKIANDMTDRWRGKQITLHQESLLFGEKP